MTKNTKMRKIDKNIILPCADVIFVIVMTSSYEVLCKLILEILRKIGDNILFTDPLSLIERRVLKILIKYCHKLSIFYKIDLIV